MRTAVVVGSQATMTVAATIGKVVGIIGKAVGIRETSISSPPSHTVEVRAGEARRETEGVRIETGSTHPHPMPGEGEAGARGTTGADTTTTMGGGVRVDTEARRMATRCEPRISFTRIVLYNLKYCTDLLDKI